MDSSITIYKLLQFVPLHPDQLIVLCSVVLLLWGLLLLRVRPREVDATSPNTVLLWGMLVLRIWRHKVNAT
jgi:hypothetical protein